MAGGRYEEVNGNGNDKSSCCLKFWLSFFLITTLALIGVIVWLVVSAKTGQSPFGPAPGKLSSFKLQFNFIFTSFLYHYKS